MLNDVTSCKLNNALLLQRFTTLNSIFTLCRKIKCCFTAIYKIEQIAILNAIFQHVIFQIDLIKMRLSFELVYCLYTYLLGVNMMTALNDLHF